MVRTWMQQTYDQFTQRVMSTRGNKIKDIDAVAQGRIFLAPQAKELGMVDELGGCEAAITYAANKVGLKEGEYDVRTLPAPKTLADLLAGHDADALTPIQPKIQIDANSFLMALPASARKITAEQIQVMQLMEKSPVLTISPFIVDVK
jgi:ClpP class serine protease